MFIGHHAAAFAATPLAPRVSLGTLFAAAILLDLVWPVLLLMGIEHVRIAPGITAFTPLDLNRRADGPAEHRAIGFVGLAQWLFVPWGWWIDRHRQVRA